MKINDFNIEENVYKSDYSYRGGYILVNCSELFPKVENALIGASQNYLGGGMLGRIQGVAQFNPEQLSKRDFKRFIKIKEKIKKYFHSLTQHEDEWENMDYETNQKMGVSAY